MFDVSIAHDYVSQSCASEFFKFVFREDPLVPEAVAIAKTLELIDEYNTERRSDESDLIPVLILEWILG